MEVVGHILHDVIECCADRRIQGGAISRGGSFDRLDAGLELCVDAEPLLLLLPSWSLLRTPEAAIPSTSGRCLLREDSITPALFFSSHDEMFVRSVVQHEWSKRTGINHEKKKGWN